MFDERYAEIPRRLLALNPVNGFNIQHLFTKAEWLEIGDGNARQNFGRKFAKAVKAGSFPAVSRNDPANEKGGNEARYKYLGN